MKIIDKNKDYYDFYQNIYRDDTFTFDRRDSYDLSKEEFASHFYDRTYGWRSQHHIRWAVVLQVCHTFWCMELIMTKKSEYGKCLDYELELLDTWQDYSIPRTAIRLTAFECYDKIENIKERVRHNSPSLRAIHFNKFLLFNGEKREIRYTPILKNIGIPAIIDAFDIYNALEAYFGEEKTASERTDAIGATNTDKIISHGFSPTTSFRNM